MSDWKMEEIASRLDKYIGYPLMNDEIRALIADWRKRGEALEAIRAKIETSKREAAETLEAEGSKYWAGWVDSCTEILDTHSALTPQQRPPG